MCLGCADRVGCAVIGSGTIRMGEAVIGVL